MKGNVVMKNKKITKDGVEEITFNKKRLRNDLYPFCWEKIEGRR